MNDNDPGRPEGYYWVRLGQNPPEVACWQGGECWLCGNERPWQADAVTVISDSLRLPAELTITLSAPVSLQSQPGATVAACQTQLPLSASTAPLS